MYARVGEHTRGRERDATLLGLGGPTRRNIGRRAGCSDSDVVALTADHENSLEKAGASSRKLIVVPGPPKGPRREAVATIGLPHGNRKLVSVTLQSTPEDFAAFLAGKLLPCTSTTRI